MSAYAALISLQKTLLTIVYLRPWITPDTAQFRTLLAEVTSLLNFLDSSKASQVSALEAKMRDAAHKAEDLIEYGILDSVSKASFYTHSKIPLLYGFYAIAVLVSSFLLLSYIELESVPARLEIGLELAFFVLNAAFLYLCFREIYVFAPLNDSQELRWVLRDFSIVAGEVNRIEEARGEAAEMSAYEALISLRRILDSIPDSGKKDHLKSLQEKVTFLLDFLGNASHTYNMSNKNLDVTINNAVSRAKRALIGFQLPRKLEFGFSTMMNVSLLDSSVLFPHVFIIVIIRVSKYYLRNSQPELTPLGIPTKLSITFESPKGTTPLEILRQLSITLASYLGSVVVALVVLAARYNSEAPVNHDLPHVVDDFSVIVRDVFEIKDGPSDSPSSSGQNFGGARRDVVVGLDGDLIKITTRLLQESPKREVTFIVGMGGIGKTTLATEVFKDPDINGHFDVCAWTAVSQEYSVSHVLLCILDSAHIPTEERRQDNKDKLALYLYQNLFDRRYLIIMDDVWDTEVWYSLSRFFPENNNGSRVLITSRLLNVASSLDPSSPPHHMQCLNKGESWNLLCKKAFGEEGFASELESIGREIATSCRGLPLAIVVIGGLLCQNIEIEFWRDVANKLRKSQLQDIKRQYWEILGLSYNHLPHHLRPCFLYMGFLPRDYEIPISRLVNLWVAEGFLQPSTSKTLEEVAEGYLEDLITRNLILVGKWSCIGKIRTCSIHDLLRDVCVENSRKENFFLVTKDGGGYAAGEGADEAPRRLNIHPDSLLVDAKLDYVRSVLCISSSNTFENPLLFDLGYVYLRVLDLLEVQFVEFPHQITTLVRLRYLALHYDGPLPPSISKLEDLETIVHHSSLRKYPLLPRVIWRMVNLRHLYVKPGCYLSESLGYQLLPTSSFLGNLQTLVGIRNFRWSKGIIERIPNLKKLGISYEVPSSVDWSAHQLDSLAGLHQLEALKIIIKYDDAGSAIYPDPPKLAFPQTLKKLSLSGCRIPWESMTAIGELPNLVALKLRCQAFSGPSWVTVEGEFPRLVFLLLEEMSFTTWETEESHFPRLQRLVLRSLDMLEGIPFSFGDIPTLEMIKLVNCRPSAEASASEIQEEQEQEGNEALKFEIERRKEADGTGRVYTEARGAGPGAFQLVWDAIQSGGYEILLVVVGLGVIVSGVFYLSRELEIRRGF